jgi:hypothetical protein
LISWGKCPGGVDLGTVEEGAVPGAQVPENPVAVLEEYFRVSTTGALVGDRDFVGRSPTYD